MSRRLLVVDDDPAVLSVLRTYFAGQGWQVEVCAEAASGLRLAGSDAPFDAVISDLHFTPAQTGEGLQIVASARQSRPRAAILLLTAAAVVGRLREEALRHGADEVIGKPASLATLREATLRALRKP